MPSSKWDSDRDEVEVDYARMDGPQPPRSSIFSGRKGMFLRVMIFCVIFLLGLIIGYALRRNVQEKFIHARVCAYKDGYQTYSSDISKELRKYINLTSIKANLRRYTGSVHLTGTGGNSALRDTIKKQMVSSHLKVNEASFSVMLSYENWTDPNIVSLMWPNGSVNFDATYSGQTRIYHPEQNFFYNAFSPSGTVQGELVYATYGEAADFDDLHTQSISCKNKIVLMQYGKISSGIKVRNAKKWGARGVLLFPASATPNPTGEVYPKGPVLPTWVIRADSVRSPGYGDPLTPELPSTDGIQRIPLSEADLPRIPVQPIGYSDAQTLRWRVSANMTIQPGQPAHQNLTVRLQVHNEMEPRPVTNVLGLIEGDEEPDRFVIVGCHYDAWTFGGVSPNTGTAVMMEIAKSFGAMAKKGWKPRRSILFAHWDAGEQGFIGSSEWVESHRKQLTDGAVAYINLAAAISGNDTLNVEAMPLLRPLIRNVTRMFPDITDSSQTLYDTWTHRSPDPNNGSLPHIHNPTWLSDQAAFVHSLGIPSMWPRYTFTTTKGDPRPYPADGTILDTFDMVSKYVDPSFGAHDSLTHVVAELALRMSTETRLPFDCRELAGVVRREVAALKESLTTSIPGRRLDRLGMLTTSIPVHLDRLDYLESAASKFTVAAMDFHARFNKLPTTNILQMRAYNDRLMTLSQAFIHPTGLPGQPQFKNILYGPSDDGDPSSPFAGIRNSFSKCARASPCSEDMWYAVERQISIALVAVESATRSLATDILI